MNCIVFFFLHLFVCDMHVYVGRRAKVHMNDMLLGDGYRTFIAPDSTFKKIILVTPCPYPLYIPPMYGSLVYDSQNDSDEYSSNGSDECDNSDGDRYQCEVRHDVGM